MVEDLPGSHRLSSVSRSKGLYVVPAPVVKQEQKSNETTDYNYFVDFKQY